MKSDYIAHVDSKGRDEEPARVRQGHPPGLLVCPTDFFLLVVVPLRALVGAHGVLILVLPIVLVTTKDGTNRLLVGGEVGDDVH
jgi:hypothetical protein